LEEGTSCEVLHDLDELFFMDVETLEVDDVGVAEETEEFGFVDEGFL
jgi:hypothetical protein